MTRQIPATPTPVQVPISKVRCLQCHQEFIVFDVEGSDAHIRHNDDGSHDAFYVERAAYRFEFGEILL